MVYTTEADLEGYSMGAMETPFKEKFFPLHLARHTVY